MFDVFIRLILGLLVFLIKKGQFKYEKIILYFCHLEGGPFKPNTCSFINVYCASQNNLTELKSDALIHLKKHDLRMCPALLLTE